MAYQYKTWQVWWISEGKPIWRLLRSWEKAGQCRLDFARDGHPLTGEPLQFRDMRICRTTREQATELAHVVNEVTVECFHGEGECHSEHEKKRRIEDGRIPAGEAENWKVRALRPGACERA